MQRSTSVPQAILDQNSLGEAPLNFQPIKLKDHAENEPHNGLPLLLDGKGFYHYNPVSNDGMRQMNEYWRAFNEKSDHLFMGRDKETSRIKNYTEHPENVGKILHPEHYGFIWTLGKNASFMAGAIESGKTFKIVSTLANIYGRANGAQRGKIIWDNQQDKKLGYVVAELLWLADNGYTFIQDPETPLLAIAVPPAQPVKNAIIRTYGHTFDPDAEKQVARVRNILCTVFPRQEKNKADTSYNPYGKKPWDKEDTFSTTAIINALPNTVNEEKNIAPPAVSIGAIPKPWDKVEKVSSTKTIISRTPKPWDKVEEISSPKTNVISATARPWNVEKNTVLSTISQSEKCKSNPSLSNSKKIEKEKGDIQNRNNSTNRVSYYRRGGNVILNSSQTITENRQNPNNNLQNSKKW